MEIDYDNYWNPEIYFENVEINKKNIEYTIEDLDFSAKKVMICGRGETSHPNFHPRFSTPTTDIDSEIYVTVDHDPNYVHHITRNGIFVLSLIVNPDLVKKIHSIGGTIYWFSTKEIKSDVPELIYGKYPIGNSGLAAISLASYLSTKFILLSGIKLSEHYQQFLPGKELAFKKVLDDGNKIFSLDGMLAEKISYDDWCNL